MVAHLFISARALPPWSLSLFCLCLPRPAYPDRESGRVGGNL